MNEIKQFTYEEACNLLESGEWKNWSDEKKVDVQLFQERLCIPFGEFLKALGRFLERPVFDMELAMNIEEIKKEYKRKKNGI